MTTDASTLVAQRSANLHLPRVTRKQAAEVCGVSVRLVNDAAKLKRTGRDDLCQRVIAGTLSINRALILAGVRRDGPDRLRTLQVAWNAATPDQRVEFVEWLNRER